MSNEIEQSIEHLTTLRDELRVKLHLAGMDAREKLSWLDDQIVALETSSEKTLTTTLRAAVDASIKKLQALKASLA
jgi:hypothetical protein